MSDRLPPLSDRRPGPKHRVEMRDAGGRKMTTHVMARDQAHAEEIAHKTWGDSHTIVPKAAHMPASAPNAFGPTMGGSPSED